MKIHSTRHTMTVFLSVHPLKRVVCRLSISGLWSTASTIIINIGMCSFRPEQCAGKARPVELRGRLTWQWTMWMLRQSWINDAMMMVRRKERMELVVSLGCFSRVHRLLMPLTRVTRWFIPLYVSIFIHWILVSFMLLQWRNKTMVH